MAAVYSSENVPATPGNVAQNAYFIVQPIKILLIGDSAVGKTSLLLRYTESVFNPTFISTIGIDFKTKTVEVDGKRVKLQIWDTAGQERFHNITRSYYRSAMGVMVFYDVTNQRSFRNCTNWLRNLKEQSNEDVERVLIGNKCDCLEADREVWFEEGKQLGAKHGIPFFETSAKTGQNVDEAINFITKAIVDKLSKTTEKKQTPGISISTAAQKQQNCCY